MIAAGALTASVHMGALTAYATVSKYLLSSY
jgi:hypothetical protein